MKASELRKIIRTASADAEVEFEHGGKKAHVTGYTVEKNVDGSTKAVVLKTGEYEKSP
jgi:hypothetical protein